MGQNPAIRSARQPPTNAEHSVTSRTSVSTT